MSEYLEKEKGNSFKHILWADDLILMLESSRGLQKQLDRVFQFCKHSQLIVNSLKTKHYY